MAYVRKTRDVFEIVGFYAGGWEAVTCEDTRREASRRLREYLENEPGTPFRLIVRRERIAG